MTGAGGGRDRRGGRNHRVQPTNRQQRSTRSRGRFANNNNNRRNGNTNKNNKKGRRRRKKRNRMFKKLRATFGHFKRNIKTLVRSDKDAKVEDVNPELHLLVEADAGKVAEGFTSDAFQAEKAEFVKHIMKNTLPIRILLKYTGRFPFTAKVDVDGSVSFTSKLYRPEGIYFCVISLLMIYFLVVGCFNLTDVMLNLTFGDGNKRGKGCQYERMYEEAVIDRNIVAFAGIWTALCHATLTSVNLFFRRHYMAQYLSFWTLAAQTIHVDVASGILKYSVGIIAFYFVMLVILVIMSVCRISALPSDLPSLFSILMFRLNFPCLLERKENKTPNSMSFTFIRYILEFVSGCLLFYIFVLSKLLIIFFLHFCRMLTRAFKSWNARFHAVINFPEKFLQSVEGRTTYNLLFKDHCTLLSLIEGTDRCFSTIVESYMALQLVSVILEAYFIYRTIIYGNEQESELTVKGLKSPFFTRPLDYIPGFVVFLTNILLLMVILKEAGRISLVAKEGLEVIRRKTMMGKKSDQELWFTLSMYFSYTSQTQLSLQGSGFFEFDNAFIITVLAIIFSSVVTVVQYAPVMDLDYRKGNYSFVYVNDSMKRQQLGEFLRDMEGLPQGHWIVNATK